LQLWFSAVQVVPLHFPLQHAPEPPSFEQLCPSDVHCVAAQVPSTPQVSEQQSVGTAHRVPWAKHLPIVEPQAFVLGSQIPEQHVSPLEHASPKMPQDTGPSPGASPVTEPSLDVAPPLPPEPSCVELPPAPEPSLEPADPPVEPADPPTETSVAELSGLEASRSALPPLPSEPTPLPARPPEPTTVDPARAPPPPESDEEASADVPPCPKIGAAASSPPQAELATMQKIPAPKSLLTFIAGDLR